MIRVDLGQAAAVMSAAERAPTGTFAGVSTDTRTLAAGQLYFALCGPNFDGHDFLARAVAGGAVAGVVRRDFTGPAALPLLRVDDPEQALGCLAAWYRTQLAGQVIAVTGSNGKTSVKNMLAHVLTSTGRVHAAVRSFNNRIGVPLTLLAASPDDDYVVVEIGTSALGEVADLARWVAPDVAVVTSIGPAHLAGLGGIEGVRQEKLSIFAHVPAGGTGVLPAAVLRVPDDRPQAEALRWITFGPEAMADLRIDAPAGDGERIRWRVNGALAMQLPGVGRHQAANGTAVLGVGQALGLAPAPVVAALATFAGTAMRSMVRRCGPVTLIDDCYNANPASLQAGLDLLAEVPGRRRVLVLGEMAELGEAAVSWHVEAGRWAARAGVGLLVAVGDWAMVAGDAARRRGPVEVRRVQDGHEAARRLPGWLRPGDVVLIKGSRSAGLEVVAEQLATTAGVASETAAGVRSG